MKRIFIGSFVLLMCTASLAQLSAGAKAELDERWLAVNEGSTATIDHSAWQEFIDEYRLVDRTDGVAKLRYDSVSARGRRALDAYINLLEQTNIDSYNSAEQFAFWVNLYNAATVQLILNNYPTASIRSIRNPWDTAFLTVEGEALTLNNIEHNILRPRWQDPRIHFVVNCASIGCPDIPERALTAENSEDVLEESALAYIEHPRGAQVQGNALVLSSIFDWYSEDFGESEANVLEYLSQYVDVAALVSANTNRTLANVNVRYNYDWDLNEP